jgi:hypothetical protein
LHGSREHALAAANDGYRYPVLSYTIGEHAPRHTAPRVCREKPSDAAIAILCYALSSFGAPACASHKRRHREMTSCHREMTSCKPPLLLQIDGYDALHLSFTSLTQLRSLRRLRILCRAARLQACADYSELVRLMGDDLTYDILCLPIHSPRSTLLMNMSVAAGGRGCTLARAGAKSIRLHTQSSLTCWIQTLVSVWVYRDTYPVIVVCMTRDGRSIRTVCLMDAPVLFSLT